MASCPDCGADITHAQTIHGEHIPLNKQPEPDGEGRYRIIAFTPLTAEPVAANAAIEAYPDHRVDCPAHDNGVRTGIR
jgi:hypothetical protein